MSSVLLSSINAGISKTLANEVEIGLKYRYACIVGYI